MFQGCLMRLALAFVKQATEGCSANAGFAIRWAVCCLGVSQAAWPWLLALPSGNPHIGGVRMLKIRFGKVA
jgi:hypothetical protein